MSPTSRLRASALALFLAPGLTLAAHLVQATPAQHDTASELSAIAAHPGRYQLASVLGFLSLALFLPGLEAMARPLWSARPRWALTGLSMSVLGLLALTALTGAGPVSLAMAQSGDRALMVAATDRYESSVLFGVWVLLMVAGYSLGPIVLALGLWRAGFGWAPAAFLVSGLVMTVLDAGRWPLAAGFALTWVGAAVVAARLWGEATPVAASAEARQGRAAWSG